MTTSSPSLAGGARSKRSTFWSISMREAMECVVLAPLMRAVGPEAPNIDINIVRASRT